MEPYPGGHSPSLPIKLEGLPRPINTLLDWYFGKIQILIERTKHQIIMWTSEYLPHSGSSA
jgi:hypothetical protein